MKLTSLLETQKPAFYLVNAAGANLTGHTSKPSFASKDEAAAYQAKFKHSKAIKTAKIVLGTSDQYGYVTPSK